MTSDFQHRFVAATEGDPRTAITLLLLHGTGGDEHDMIPIGAMFGKGVNLLSPKGKVSEFDSARYFRRLAEGVFDVEDLKFRTTELRDFIVEAAATHNFDGKRVVALGYSNGANIAGSMLLMYPDVLAGMMQFRPMIPFEPSPEFTILGTPVCISSGATDFTVSPEERQHWSHILTMAGADVTTYIVDAGHNLTQTDVTNAIAWFHERF